MVHYTLQITAHMENVKTLEPMGGFDDPNFLFYFKLKCDNCLEVNPKEVCISLDELVPIPNSRDHATLFEKCKTCEEEGYIKIVPGEGRPLTGEDSEEERYAPLMCFDCHGWVPLEFSFLGPQWRVESVSGTVYENVDLSQGEWAEFDEKGNCPVAIANLRSRFVLEPKAEELKNPYVASSTVDKVAVKPLPVVGS